MIILIAEYVACASGERARASIKELIGSVPKIAIIKNGGKEDTIQIKDTLAEIEHPVLEKAKIIKAIIISIMGAAILLLIVVLPAQYGIDTTVAGKAFLAPMKGSMDGSLEIVVRLIL